MKCILLLKKDCVNNELLLSIHQLPNNYQIREMLVWHKDSLLLLMSTAEDLQGEKPHGILGYIDTSNVNSVKFDHQETDMNIIDLIYAHQDVSILK